MMVQLPLIYLTDRLPKLKAVNGKFIGNLIFWVSFCLVGQPLAALSYHFAWHSSVGSASKPHLWLQAQP